MAFWGSDGSCFGRVRSSFGGSRLDISSPCSAKSAMTLPTFISFVPSGTCNVLARVFCVLIARTSILPTTPSSWASTSSDALSVSCQFDFHMVQKTQTAELTISNKTSPVVNVSPSFFFHAMILPCVIVGDIAGISRFVMACLTNE